jgi:hypothetical protein
MTEGYEVPKRQVEAAVTLMGEDPRPVRLFLAERAQNHSGPQRPGDLLNDATEDYFPVRGPDESLALLNRSAVLVLSVPASEQASPEEIAAAREAEGMEAFTTRRIRVRMEDGSEVTGTVSYVRPAGERRIRDYLNRTEAFIPLRDGDTVRFVNRSRIARVTFASSS